MKIDRSSSRFDVAAALALCFLFAAPAGAQIKQEWRPGQESPQFHLLEVKGVVQLVRPSTQEIVDLTTEIAPATEDEIQTGADGYVKIGLEDGSQVEVFSNSRVQLGIPRSSWMSMLNVFLGRVRIMIEKIGGRPNPYSFATPTAVMGVRGTIFDVAVDQNTATIVAVSVGSVQVENSRFQGRGVLVNQGYRTIVRPNALPSKPERFSGDGANFGGMANKQGKMMSPQANSGTSGMMGGTPTSSSGTMGKPGSTGQPGMSGTPSGMPGMGPGMKKKPGPP